MNNAQKLFNIILALLVALGGWMFVVYNYYPMTEVDYSDVPISFIGERALAERGLAVSSTENDTVSATLNQKRVDVNKFAPTDIMALADLSDCMAGENRVSINVSGPTDTSVISSGPDHVTVNVERTVSEFMDIDVVYDKGAPEEAEPIATDMSHVEAEVICAASKLDDVKSIAAVLDYNEVNSKTKSYSAKLVALDADGEAVKHVVIYPEEISLDASAGVTKSVSLNVPVNNKSNDNYERKYTAPSTVVIKGMKEDLDKISAVEAKEIDIRYVYDSQEIPIEIELPEGVYLSNTSKDAVLKVVATKAATESKSEDGDENGAG